MRISKRVAPFLILVVCASVFAGYGVYKLTTTGPPTGSSGGLAGPGGTGDLFRVSSGALNFTAINNIYGIYLTYFSPQFGPLAGGQAVQLEGLWAGPATISGLYSAVDAYRVYFDDRVAPFDLSIAPPVTPTDMFVTTPPGAAAGLVNVTVIETIYTMYTVYFTYAPNAVMTTLSIYGATLPKSYRYLEDLLITDVIPDEGPLPGGQKVRLVGKFPVSAPITNLAAATAAYDVYFDNDLPARFDATAAEIVNANSMYVITPRGRMPGLVNVSVIESLYPINSSALVYPDGYTYLGLRLDFVDPDAGPLAGGQPVTLGGSFPVLNTISSIYSAYSAYAVYFGANRAGFDINSMPEVVTSTRMYVITPPGDAPGFVDVRVEDLSDPTIFDVLEDGYEYLLGGVGQWVICDIIPRPVGRLLSGQLQVELIVTGFIENAFIVPQGGDPFNITHRINLVNTGGDFWTNVEPIDTLMIDNDGSGDPSFGDLFADGHAAVYLQSGSAITGLDPFDLTDGSRITGQAVLGRHFLIDTLPPRMIVGPGGQRANAMAGMTNLVPIINTTGVFRPFPLPALPRGFPTPYDSGFIRDPFIQPRPSDDAQMFFQVGSITNNFPLENLFLIVNNISFQDFSVHDAFGFTPSGFDVDRFSPFVDTRQISGFEPEIYRGGDVQAILENGEVAQWVFDAGSDIFAAADIYASFIADTSGGPGSIDTGFMPPTLPLMDAQWDFTTSGVVLSPDTIHSIVRFRAHDRAGAFNRDFTPPDLLLNPLHLWWLRETRARQIPNIEGAELGGEIRWTLDPDLDTQTIVEPFPEFSYRVWESELPGRSAEAYNALYLPSTGWTGWSAVDFIGLLDFVDNLGIEDHWVLLVVMGMDEAGNLQGWPSTDLSFTDFTDPDSEVFVNDGVTSGVSWQRFFVPSPAELIDTAITPTFWHEDLATTSSPPVPDLDDERNFGAATIVPLPQDVTVSTLYVRFDIRMTVPDILVPEDAFVIWELLHDGVLEVEGVTGTSPSGVVSVWLPLPDGVAPLGDLLTRKPASYVFRARTVAGDEEDATPANFQFTVVDKVIGYVEPKDSEDSQPIKVFETQ